MGLFVVYYIGTHRKFDGQCFLFYLLWYGTGRGWIEGLRTDSLYFFGLELFGIPLRTSQVLAVLSAVAAGAVMVWMLRRPHDKENLYVNRNAAQDAREETKKEEEE